MHVVLWISKLAAAQVCREDLVSLPKTVGSLCEKTSCQLGVRLRTVAAAETHYTVGKYLCELRPISYPHRDRQDN